VSHKLLHAREQSSLHYIRLELVNNFDEPGNVLDQNVVASDHDFGVDLLLRVVSQL